MLFFARRSGLKPSRENFRIAYGVVRYFGPDANHRNLRKAIGEELWQAASNALAARHAWRRPFLEGRVVGVAKSLRCWARGATKKEAYDRYPRREHPLAY